MSKRTDRIRSLFGAAQQEALSADNAAAPAAVPAIAPGPDQPPVASPALQRVTAGAVRSLQDSFSALERENASLAARLSQAGQVLVLEPALIDPAPLADRFADDDDAGFAALKASLAARGQEVPILVRPHPGAEGRFQCAYGHRRLRALRELGLGVRAEVRPLSDADLVTAQGLENTARQDLSFIERAVFAARLEDAGFARAVVQAALAIDRAEASKLISVARGVAADIVAAIGRAPRIGRARWQALAGALARPGAEARVRAALKDANGDSNARFAAALAAAQDSLPETPPDVALPPDLTVDGRTVARFERAGGQVRLVIADGDSGFAARLAAALPQLYARWLADSAAAHPDATTQE